MINDCALPVGVSALSCAIANELDDANLGVAAALFTVLGDQLALILAQRALCKTTTVVE